MIWTKEDIEKVEKFIEIRNRGYYVSGEQLTEVYNRVLNKHVNPTNCGSCLRQRVNELADALDRFKKQLEIEKKKEEAAKAEEENNKPKTKKK